MATRYKGENTEMQRAFIFCLFTGLRWCDVKLLTYANVDPMTKTLRFQQKKVRNVSSRSWVEIPNKLTPMKLFKLTPVLACVC